MPVCTRMCLSKRLGRSKESVHPSNSHAYTDFFPDDGVGAAGASASCVAEGAQSEADTSDVTGVRVGVLRESMEKMIIKI